jgi:hypothetical protein
MSDCEYLEKCPIFIKFVNEGAKSFWIRFYCRGERQESCARKKLKKQGQEVPADLLPSGDRMST